ncbi:MAG: sulfatase-like hydrolase/transferase [Endomicrobium sp.]|jgi:phosphoglycerol transferase MdoB-like AlkP superfamily enzyme|nr:sulfatase-like hydrolase/transferase [Endomicrobium sp.]
MIKQYGFEKYFDCLLKIIPVNAAVLAAMTVYRIFFFFHFSGSQSFNGLYFDVLKAFWLGLRFDLSVLAYVNSIVILILTILLFFKSYKAFKAAAFALRFYYWFAFTLIAFLNFVDMGFYTYFNEHLNILLFDFFTDDTAALIKTIAKDYRFLTALISLIIISFVIYKLSSFTYKIMTSKHCIIDTDFWRAAFKAAIVLTVAFLTFLFARGTVSMFPLGTFYTQISSNSFINKTAISSLHSFFDAISAKMEASGDKINIASKLGAPQEDVNPSMFNKISQENKAAQEIKPNVVFIIMESFGELPVLYNSQTFDVLGELKTHFEQDTVLYNFLAAGRITIHAIESTVLNMPQRPFAMQITQTPKAFHHFSSAFAAVYKKAGYATKAVYGGSLNWRGIENFLKAQGFDETYGEGSIKNEYRHEWGINDAQFFEIVLRELKNGGDKPKLIYALSTGTHPPYYTPPYNKPLPLEIPKDVKQMMPEEKYPEKIFESYQFANRQAAKFLDEIKKSEFSKNTIVVITGDHNLREIYAQTPEELFKRYAVPLYIYMPESLKKDFDLQTAGSHTDIAPTLYDLSLSSVNYVSAGTSLLNNDKPNIAFNSEGFILSQDKAVSFNINTGETLYFDFNDETKMLKYCPQTLQHVQMLEYYKKTLSAADAYLKQTAKGEQ